LNPYHLTVFCDSFDEILRTMRRALSLFILSVSLSISLGGVTAFDRFRSLEDSLPQGAPVRRTRGIHTPAGEGEVFPIEGSGPEVFPIEGGISDGSPIEDGIPDGSPIEDGVFVPIIVTSSPTSAPTPLNDGPIVVPREPVFPEPGEPDDNDAPSIGDGPIAVPGEPVSPEPGDETPSPTQAPTLNGPLPTSQPTAAPTNVLAVVPREPVFPEPGEPDDNDAPSIGDGPIAVPGEPVSPEPGDETPSPTQAPTLNGPLPTSQPTAAPTNVLALTSISVVKSSPVPPGQRSLSAHSRTNRDQWTFQGFVDASDYLAVTKFDNFGIDALLQGSLSSNVSTVSFTPGQCRARQNGKGVICKAPSAKLTMRSARRPKKLGVLEASTKPSGVFYKVSGKFRRQSFESVTIVTPLSVSLLSEEFEMTANITTCTESSRNNVQKIRIKCKTGF
jgi:hypothetical protein